MTRWLPLGIAAALTGLGLANLASASAGIDGIIGRPFHAQVVSAVVAVGLGAVVAPVTTLLVLAVLHNLTPVAFLADVDRGRPQVWLGALAVFVGAPLLVASGAVHAVLEPLGAWWPDASWFAHDGLARHLGAYLPEPVRSWPSAPRLFAGVVVAQCLHYVAVIGILPRYAPEARGALGRVPASWFVGAVVVTSAVFVVAYALDFSGSRTIYGVAAAVHAWLEVPVLLVAVARAP